MTVALLCPFCSSEKVYSLLNTLHCKRCKNMWKADAEDPDSYTSGYRDAPINRGLRMVKKTESLEKRLEKRLNDYLKKGHGRFCMNTTDWKSGDVTREIFRRYLKRCVRKKVITERKDQYGRTWYSGNGKCPAADQPVRITGNRRACLPDFR